MLDTGLRGKKALVTGGGVGIGQALALALAAEGVDVAIVDRHDYPETIGQLRTHGVKAVHLGADVSREVDVVRMVREAIDALEGLDLYINNVAVHWDEPATKITADGWENTLTTNLSACAYGCREVGRHFVAQQSGSILIIGSTATYTLYPGEIAYRVTKTALIPYLEGLAAELAPFKIRVNMLTPGLFITRMTKDLEFEGELMNRVLGEIPWRRPGDALKELAPAALMLLSDCLSGYTTGANLVVDGGIKLRVLPWRTENELREMNQ